MYRQTWRDGFYWEEEAYILEAAANRILDAWQKACELHKSGHFDGKSIDDYRYLLCHNEIQMFPTYMLLMGYALENIIKGIIICQLSLNDPASVTKTNFSNLEFNLKDGKGKRGIQTHKFLDELLKAEAINITPSDPEKDLLKEIEDCILWGGRYPIPNKVKSNETFTSPTAIIYMSPRRSKQIKALYEKWIKELHRLIALQMREKS